MAGYRHRGDKNALDEYNSAYDEVQRLSDVGNEARETINTLDVQIQTAEQDFNLSDKDVLELKQKLKSAEAKRNSLQERHDRFRKDKEGATQAIAGLKDSFSEAKKARDFAKSKYLESISSSKSEDNILKNKIVGPSKGLLNVYALGDIHGWAPGLTAFLTQHKLAEISISGMNLNKDPSMIYPDYSLNLKKGKLIEGQWIDGSTFTPLQPKERNELYRGAFSDIGVSPSANLESGLFLQVGDLNDRGDYSELIFDIMRKLTLSSGGRAFALIGNHEEMLLRGNYKNWIHNEEESGFFQSLESPGSFRLRHEFLNIKDNVESYRRSVFFSYCAHFAHMLLTQEYVIRQMLDDSSRKRYIQMTQPALDLSSISENKLEQIAISNDWKTVEFCYSWLEKVWKVEKPIIVPGAIVLLSVGHVLGLHASINSLNKFFDSKRSGDFKKHFNTKSGAEINLHLYSHVHGQPSPDTEMLWQRDGKTWTSKSPSKKMSDSVIQINKHLPHVTSIVQGHEPLSSTTLDIKSHEITVPTGVVNISNLDVGMTPVYLPTKLSNKYDVKRVPKGISIPTFGRKPELFGTEFQTTNNLVVITKVEQRGETYCVSLCTTSPRKEIAKIFRTQKGYRIKITAEDIAIGIVDKGNTTLTKEANFPISKNVTINLYKLVTKWFKSYPVTFGSLGLGNLVQTEEKNDPIMIEAKKNENAERKKLEREAAEKKAKEDKEAAERRAKEDKEAAERKAKGGATTGLKITVEVTSQSNTRTETSTNKSGTGVAPPPNSPPPPPPPPNSPPNLPPPPQTTGSSSTSGATLQTEKVFKKTVYVDLEEFRCRELRNNIGTIIDFKDVMFIFSSLKDGPDVENFKSIRANEYDAIVRNLSELENSYRICDKKLFKSLSDADKKLTISLDKLGYKWNWKKNIKKLIGGSD